MSGMIVIVATIGLGSLSGLSPKSFVFPIVMMPAPQFTTVDRRDPSVVLVAIRLFVMDFAAPRRNLATGMHAVAVSGDDRLGHGR